MNEKRVIESVTRKTKDRQRVKDKLLPIENNYIGNTDSAMGQKKAECWCPRQFVKQKLYGQFLAV